MIEIRTWDRAHADPSLGACSSAWVALGCTSHTVRGNQLDGGCPHKDERRQLPRAQKWHPRRSHRFASQTLSLAQRQEISSLARIPANIFAIEIRPLVFGRNPAYVDHCSASERGIDLAGYPHPSFQFSSGIGDGTCSRSARIAGLGWATPSCSQSQVTRSRRASLLSS